MKYFQFVSKFRPEIKYARATTALIDNKGKIFADERRNTIEFCVNNTDVDLVIQTEEEIIPFKHYDFVVLFPDKQYSIRPERPQSDNGGNALYIIAAELAECQYMRCDTNQIQTLLSDADKTEAARWILLPERKNLNESQYRKVAKLMRTIINHYDYASASQSEYVLCIAKWFELAALLDQSVRVELCNKPATGEKLKASADYYVCKTKKYIERHYTEHITIPEIAQDVGVSPNYLSALFKEGTGDTIITYINHFRVRRLCELLQNDANQSFEDLCNTVGINDERYARRLFKKFFGVSIQRYKQLADGVTTQNEDALESDMVHDS